MNELDEFCIEHFGSRLDQLPTEFGRELESMYKKGAIAVESKLKAAFAAGFSAGLASAARDDSDPRTIALRYERAKINNEF